METAAMSSAKHILFLFGTILLFGSVSGLLARKLRFPDVVLFLLIGILLGPEGWGVVQVPSDSTFNQLILIFGSCYILFDGGAALRLSVLKEVWLTVAVISTAGILISATLTGMAASVLLGLPLVSALLLGSCISSTDPAVLVPIFKQVRVRQRVAQTVMSESAFNDAMGAITTFALLEVLAGSGTFSFSAAAADLAVNALTGIAAGLLLGYAAAFLIAHEKFSFLLEYAPLVTLMSVAGAYLSAETLHASGFMAVFVFGIMLGNKESFGFAMEPGEQEKLEDFVATTSLVMRMFIFILLGSQVQFSLVGRYLGSGIMLVAVFILLVRPVTVLACALPDRRARWSFRELLFICWTRETGVIPAALSGILVGMKVPGAEVIASVTFLTILFTILVQATTKRWLAGKLGLLEP